MIPRPRVPGPVQTLRFGADPIGFLVDCHERLGDVFHLRLLGEDYVFVVPPALNAEVFRRDEAGVSAGAMRAPFMEFLVGERSVLVLEGDDWQRERRRLAAPFHGRAVEAWRERVGALAAEHVDRLPLGRPFAARPYTQEFALDVILRIVFGVADPALLTRMRAGLGELLRTPLVLTWPPVRRLAARASAGPWRTFTRRRDAFDALLVAEIRRRRTQPPGDDVISLLMHETTDAQLRDDLVTIIGAGHETTATALAWALELLSRHPAAAEALRADVAEHGDRGPYLDAVVREVLRVRPILTDAARTVTEPLTLGGHDIPVGWQVAPAIAVTQRLQDAWEDPAAFRPERFLAERPAYDAWLPFGGGRRRCLGSGLAQMEMRAYLARLVQQRDVAPASARPERATLRGFTVAPARGGRVVTKRSAAGAGPISPALAGTAAG